jgi:hypothetical protein
MKNGVCLLQKKYVGSNHLLQQTKQKKTESKNKDTLRKTHRIRSNKNIGVLKDDLIFVDEEGVPRGIPKL